ncbi:unnamed protein product [Ostreobium quekettii]|uniref:Protein kinase domain-containing protein n=1 Tax=Ostreobium quekettii TaxID=121088 RepID=A0A8S1IU90_9CHLO|nr:unnamed protein product [Ostreobium quekettii]
MDTNLEARMGDMTVDFTCMDILRIGLDVARGMSHLHDNGVTHFDIKPSNILLDREDGAKLADFTCSRRKLTSTISAEGRGTLGYVAPEILKHALRKGRFCAQDPKPHFPAEKIDVYSFGKVLLKCLTGDLSHAESQAEKARGSYPELWDLIRQCVAVDPVDRSTCREVVAALEGMVEGRGDWRAGRPREEIWPESTRL